MPVGIRAGISGFYNSQKTTKSESDINPGQSMLCLSNPGEIGAGYVLVVYDPAGPHEALPGPLELQQRQMRVSH